jgi:hypothetical protein
MRTDRRTDMMKPIVAFRNFANAPKKIACMRIVISETVLLPAMHYFLESNRLLKYFLMTYAPPPLPSPLYNGYQVSFAGVKRPRRDVGHAPRISPRLKTE